MIDAKRLMEQFLGPNAGASLGGLLGGSQTGGATGGQMGASGGGGLQDMAGQARGMLDQLASRTPGGMTGLAAGGGLLALLLGGKQLRSAAGGLVGVGGAAALGALAYRAWQNYQSGQSPAAAPQAALPAPEQLPAQFQPAATVASGGEPFELSLMRAMIGAAKADGHVDAEEQGRIFKAVEQMNLDAEAKGFVFDALNAPADPGAIAAAATTPEQASQLYLASRLAVDPDHPGERAYLEALAHRLKLPQELVAQLDAQANAG